MGVVDVRDTATRRDPEPSPVPSMGALNAVMLNATARSRIGGRDAMILGHMKWGVGGVKESEWDADLVPSSKFWTNFGALRAPANFESKFRKSLATPR